MPLFVDPATLTRWIAADSLIFLVGGYDGNASFGDVAQLLGALQAVEARAGLVTPVLVVEAGLRREHTRIAASWPDHLDHQLVAFFAGPDEYVPDGLVPLPSLANAVGIVLYFYGGGYANERWGARKNAMAEAVRDWASGPWPELVAPPVLATGLQVDPSLADDKEGLGSWLGRAALLTGRDAASVRILSGINERARLGPDDALAVIAGPGPADTSPRRSHGVRIGVHVNTEDYSTPDAGRRLTLVAATVEALSRGDARRPEIVPILAYEGLRIRESETFATLGPALEDAGCVVADPIDLSSAHGLSQLAELDAVVACSYHVALSSALYGVPTWLMVDNEYYEQKLLGIEDQIGPGLVRAVRVTGVDGVPDSMVLRPGGRARRPMDEALVLSSVAAAHAEVEQVLVAALLEQWSRHVGMLSTAYVDVSVEAARLRSAVGDYIQAVQASAEREIRLQSDLDATRVAVESLSAHLEAIEQSRIWRMSAPYRRLRNRLSGSGDAG